MLTAAQLMDGSRVLATASKLREEHAKCAKVSFDRAMYARAADDLRAWSEQLERWARYVVDNPDGASYLERYSDQAITILAQLQPIKAGAEA